MKVPINEGDGSINIQELEQNLLGDANWIPRLNTLVLAEINNNLNAIRAVQEQEHITHSGGGPEAAITKMFKGAKTIGIHPIIRLEELYPGYNFDSKNTQEQRPWGGFEVLAEGEGYKVKRIWVNTGEAISLQSHELRDEMWTIVKGKLSFQGETGEPVSGNTIRIDRNKKHRATNNDKDILEFIEVQTGECKEDDIVRYEDKYGRV